MHLTAGLTETLLVCGIGGIAGLGRRWGKRRRAQLIGAFEARLQAERAEGERRCFALLEALTYAVEARHPYNLGHLECVQRSAEAMAEALRMPAAEMTGLRMAALLHNIGRLGVPEHILHKTGALSPEEQEKLRAHPVLGARILASISLPWPVAPIIRHQAEHWDGSGYPDSLQGETIPLGARILAVANTYSALRRPRSFRTATTSEEALTEIESRAGTQFDPAVVAAFRSVVSALPIDAPLCGSVELPTEQAGDRFYAPLPAAVRALSSSPARAALDDIAAAQRETLELFLLTQAVSRSLHMEPISDALLSCTRAMVPCAACVLFLPEDDEFLRAAAALGANERHLLGSLARVGTYLTGRAFSRGELMCASFLPDDLILRDVSDAWTPLRSTLIVPLTAGEQVIGTINLYAEEPNAFGPDAQRVVRLIASQASQAIDNAHRFAAVQETAYTDAMTGLRNARYLREFLDRETNRAARENTSLAVLNIDLDNFKPINDNFGHARGDQILRDVAEIMQGHIRNYDLAARYAGDEFVVVLARAGRIQAETVATKIKLSLERHGQQLTTLEPGFPLLGASIGIALFPDDGQDIQTLLCRSDAAMYSDKQNRRASRAA